MNQLLETPRTALIYRTHRLACCEKCPVVCLPMLSSYRSLTRRKKKNNFILQWETYGSTPSPISPRTAHSTSEGSTYHNRSMAQSFQMQRHTYSVVSAPGQNPQNGTVGQYICVPRTVWADTVVQPGGGPACCHHWAELLRQWGVVVAYVAHCDCLLYLTCHTPLAMLLTVWLVIPSALKNN